MGVDSFDLNLYQDNIQTDRYTEQEKQRYFYIPFEISEPKEKEKEVKLHTKVSTGKMVFLQTFFWTKKIFDTINALH